MCNCPRPYENEREHESFAKAFIERNLTAHFARPYPSWSSFASLKLSGVRSPHRLPDFALLSVTRNRTSIPECRFHGVELKVPAGIRLDAIQQAVEQRQYFHTLSLLLLLPQEFPQDELPAICDEARKNGVGVFRTECWHAGSPWKVLVKPAEHKPPAQIDGFLLSRLTAPQRNLFRIWMGGDDG